MWKKILTPTLILALGILFGLTWYCSIKAEEYFSLWVERSNHYAPAFVTTELVSYERQFFTAEAVTSVEIPEIGHLDFHHLIRHYVWGVTMITTPMAENEDRQPFLKGLRIVTDIGPTGAARARLTMPQLVTTSPDDSALVIDHIAGEWRVNAAATEASWDLTLDQARLTLTAESSLLFSGLQSSGKLSDLDQLPIGYNRTGINTITLNSGSDRLISLEGFGFYGDNRFDAAERYRTSSEFSFASMTAGNTDFQHGRMLFELKDIDPLLVELFLHSRDDLRQQLATGEVTGARLAERFVLPLYTELLRSGLTLVLADLSLTTPGGFLEGEGQLSLRPGTEQNNLYGLLNQIDASLKVDFDIRILSRLYQLFGQNGASESGNLAVQEEELRMVLGGLTQLGFLSRQEGERFRLLLVFEEGRVSLNGQPFKLF